MKRVVISHWSQSSQKDCILKYLFITNTNWQNFSKLARINPSWRTLALSILLKTKTWNHVTGRQLFAELAERVVGEVWDPDPSLPRPPPAEARGAQGISPEGDQKRAQGENIVSCSAPLNPNFHRSKRAQRTYERLQRTRSLWMTWTTLWRSQLQNSQNFRRNYRS